MSNELEQKYRVRMHVPYQDRIKEHGGKLISEKDTTNYFLIVNGNLLRNRDGKELTFKGNPITVYQNGVPVKSRPEDNIALDAGAEGIREFFKQLPYYVTHRKKFELDGIEVDLDKVCNVGRFVEIEGPLERIVEVQKKLSLKTENLETRSYAELAWQKWLMDGKPVPTFYDYPLPLKAPGMFAASGPIIIHKTAPAPDTSTYRHTKQLEAGPKQPVKQ